MRRFVSLLVGTGLLLTVAAAPVAAGGPPTPDAFYADGTLYRTIATPASFVGTGAPDSSFEPIYALGPGLKNVAEAAPGQPRGAYFPVGMGRRVCVGESFAWTEAVLVLATLARDWAPALAAAKRGRSQRVQLGVRASAIAAGEFHSCALTVAGEIWCWGMNSDGQLGMASPGWLPVPTHAFP